VEWTEPLVVPVLEAGKDPSCASSYRPISLTRCVCKLKEKMVNLRIVYMLERNGILPNAQYGFGRNKIRGNILYSIQNFMTNRSFRVVCGGAMSERKGIENGVVQGAVMSYSIPG
jgi:hypothetical protein